MKTVRSKYLGRLLLFAVGAYCFGSLPVAKAATTEVDIVNYSFAPAEADINVNDTVNWVWQADDHSTTSDDGLWDSGVYNTGYNFSHTFNYPGTYPYYCVVHGFTGSVVVSKPPIEVDIVNYAFVPDTANINVNDTINWVWQADDHSSTSDDSLWDSGIYDTGFNYSYQFKSPGSFPYYCVVHGFTGTVNVAGSVTPPIEVDIINYAFVPDAVTINVNDTVNWVWQADYHSSTADDGLWDSGVYDTGYSFSYQFTYPATFPYYCVVHGFTGTVTVVTPPVSITLSAPQRTSPTSFQFNYTATVGSSYAVDRAAALPNWTALQTNMAAASVVLFQDNGAPGGASYYRVRQVPNP